MGKISQRMNIGLNSRLYLTLFLLTIALGLFSRSAYFPLSAFIADFTGDILWGLMVFWLVSILRLKWPIKGKVIAALIFSFAIEFLQLYQAPWIEGLRENKFARLVLGSGFKFEDLLCYSAGIFIGLLIDHYLVRAFYAQKS